MNFLFLSLLQENTTPDTSVYVLAGYTIFFFVLIIYPLSLYLRSHKVKQDLAFLDNLEKETDENL